MKAKPEDIAQLCVKGHLIVGSVNRHPDFTAKFCEKCGSSTIISCQNCDWPIRGISPTAWMADMGPYRPPSFCGECGTPFPWTKTALDAAKSLTDEQDSLTAPQAGEMLKSVVLTIATGEAKRWLGLP